VKAIGIVGCGAIGSEVAKAIDRKFSNKARVVALFDIKKDKAIILANSLNSKPEILEIDSLILRSDLVIEAASTEISASLTRKVISAGREIMVMSVGGLLKESQELFDLARQAKRCIYLPSGALSGIDGLKAACVDKINKVTLTTRKPLVSLKGAPYLREKNISLDNIRNEEVIFEGKVEEAIKGFPKNINVSSLISLVGVNTENITIRIITSPNYKVNTHELEIEGDFGRLYLRNENFHSAQNPKTSFLAILSAIATLKNILDYVKIGT
jgi:aspartate dehydrogenase